MTIRRRTEAGFGSAILLALMALAALFCLATADAANVLVTRARAQAAADAAALAAATAQWPFTGARQDPETAAERTAEANGAELVSCDCPLRGEVAVVRVRIPTRIRMLAAAPVRIEAVAEARLDPGVVFSPPDGR